MATTDDKELDFSVLIPAKNEEIFLKITLPEIIKQAQQTGKRYEIIVLDNESTDGTEKVATSLGVKCIPVSGTIGAVRAKGVNVAKGRALVFIDGDCIPSADWLQTGLMELDNRPDAVIGVNIKRPINAPWLVRYWALDKKFSENRPGSLPGASLFFPAQLVNEIGNFRAELVSSEDIDFTVRAKERGKTLTIPCGLDVTHLGWPETIIGFIARQIWHARSYVEFNRGPKDPIFIATVLFIICFVFTFFSGLLNEIMLSVSGFIFLVLIPALHAIHRIEGSGEKRGGRLLFMVYLVSFLYFTGRSLGLMMALWLRLSRKVSRDH